MEDFYAAASPTSILSQSPSKGATSLSLLSKNSGSPAQGSDLLASLKEEEDSELTDSISLGDDEGSRKRRQAMGAARASEGVTAELLGESGRRDHERGGVGAISVSPAWHASAYLGTALPLLPLDGGGGDERKEGDNGGSADPSNSNSSSSTSLIGAYGIKVSVFLIDSQSIRTGGNFHCSSLGFRVF